VETWTVELSRSRIEYAELEIKADTRNEAYAKARLHHLHDKPLNWKDGGVERGSLQVAAWKKELA